MSFSSLKRDILILTWTFGRKARAYTGFNSLKRDISILTNRTSVPSSRRSSFQFPEAGHFDSYSNADCTTVHIVWKFQFPEAGHFDSYYHQRKNYVLLIMLFQFPDAGHFDSYEIEHESILVRCDCFNFLARDTAIPVAVRHSY